MFWSENVEVYEGVPMIVSEEFDHTLDVSNGSSIFSTGIQKHVLIKHEPAIFLKKIYSLKNLIILLNYMSF